LRQKAKNFMTDPTTEWAWIITRCMRVLESRQHQWRRSNWVCRTPCAIWWRFASKDRTEHIGIEGRGIGLGRLLGSRSRLSFGTSVVRGNIEAAKALDRLVDEIAHVTFVADVGAQDFRFGAKSAQLSDQCLPSVVAPTGNYDARTF
jgi:hypothetical protein